MTKPHKFSLPGRLTLAQWEKLAPKVKDISNELPDEFLGYGRWMRAKIQIGDKKYYADGWSDPNGYTYVEIRNA